MTHTIYVPRSNSVVPSEVVIGDALSRLPLMLDGRRPIIITDSNVFRIYESWIGQYPHVVIGTGEVNKTLDTVGEICRQLLARGADRGSYLVGVGGGIVTDITGFVASTYMRGVGFGFVATTLLAQVDASVGGKNGVNLDGFKNIIGTFNQPDFVLCDSAMLGSLPQRELVAGMAEIIKCGFIRENSILDIFEGEEWDAGAVQRAIVAAVELKAAVVTADEREHGERKLLNLGHTFAHAVEKCSSQYLHGEAVAIGLCVAARISMQMGLLCESEYARVVAIISRAGLPTALPEGVSPQQLIQSALSDKKREAATIDIIVMEGIGRAATRRLSIDEFIDVATEALA